MHKAKACILLCMDFRFQKLIQDWLSKNGYLGKCDEVVVAGASRDLVKPIEPFHKEALIRQLELSVKLHDPDEIIIIDHQDCGGYAQDETIEKGLSLKDDKKKHEFFSKETRNLLLKKFPGKIIRTFYATLDGVILELK